MEELAFTGNSTFLYEHRAGWRTAAHSPFFIMDNTGLFVLRELNGHLYVCSLGEDESLDSFTVLIKNAKVLPDRMRNFYVRYFSDVYEIVPLPVDQVMRRNNAPSLLDLL